MINTDTSPMFVLLLGLWALGWLWAAAYGGILTYAFVSEHLPSTVALGLSGGAAMASGWGFTRLLGYTLIEISAALAEIPPDIP